MKRVDSYQKSEREMARGKGVVVRGQTDGESWVVVKGWVRRGTLPRSRKG